MAMRERIAAALGCLTAFGWLAAGVPGRMLVEALALYPLVGLVLGGVAVVVARVGLPWANVAGVLTLVALEGVRGPVGIAAAVDALTRPGGAAAVLARLRGRPRAPGIAVATAALVAKLWAAMALPAAVLTPALLLAPLLGAWAIVVQCYGGTPVRARGRAAAIIGRARFQEFGWASLTAFGITLALGEAVGLLVLLAVIAATLGLRLLAHARLGGLTGRLLSATRELVETVVLVTLAVLVLGG